MNDEKLDWYQRKSREFTCRGCGWQGLGNLLHNGEWLSPDFGELLCPSCDGRVLLINFPNEEETRRAADVGDPEAIGVLPRFEESKRFRERLRLTKASPVDDPITLRGCEVRCELDLQGPDDIEGDHWLVLRAKGIEIHREVVAWENPEPAQRLFAAMLDRYGPQLRSFDFYQAVMYLAGDRLDYKAKLVEMVSVLPEGGRSSWPDLPDPEADGPP